MSQKTYVFGGQVLPIIEGTPIVDIIPNMMKVCFMCDCVYSHTKLTIVIGEGYVCVKCHKEYLD